jgi:hypothetical protein
MWHAGRAGITAAIPYGFRPDAPSGHYQRHIHAVMPIFREREQLYDVPVASYNRDNLCKGIHQLVTIPLHEVVSEAFATDPSLRVRLDEMVSAKELPAAFYSNPVVEQGTRDGGLPVMPISIFVDAVPYSLSDSVIGWWAINEITGSRSLIVALRKSVCCICGCRGWCTFRAIWAWLWWSLSALAEGKCPSSRHDYEPFNTDVRRAELGGKAMSCRAALLYLKGDWAEYSSTVGMPSWQDGLRPCFVCNADRGNFYTTEGISAVTSPWRENGDDDYFQACARCERHVVIDARTHAVLCGLLHYDKRQHGNRGRCLVAPCPELGLEAGDRLTEEANLGDVSNFDDLNEFPRPVVFWRQAQDTLTRHRNPVFSKELGSTPGRSLTVDVLHCLNLGVMLTFCRHIILFLLGSGVWGVHGTMAEQIEAGLLVCRHSLAAFYRRRHAEFPHEVLTRIVRFGKKHVGKTEDKPLKTKGAETWGCSFSWSSSWAKTLAGLAPKGANCTEPGKHWSLW